MPTTVVPLRELLREPSKVKRLTKAGHVVRITDRGAPLWDLQSVAAEKQPDNAFRNKLVEEFLDDLLAEAPLPKSPKSVPIADVVKQSRG